MLPPAVVLQRLLFCRFSSSACRLWAPVRSFCAGCLPGSRVLTTMLLAHVSRCSSFVLIGRLWRPILFSPFFEVHSWFGWVGMMAGFMNLRVKSCVG